MLLIIHLSHHSPMGKLFYSQIEDDAATASTRSSVWHMLSPEPCLHLDGSGQGVCWQSCSHGQVQGKFWSGA